MSAAYPIAASDLERMFTYSPPRTGQPERYQLMREKALQLAKLIADDSNAPLCPPSPERAVALRKLREYVMWANAAIALNE